MTAWAWVLGWWDTGGGAPAQGPLTDCEAPAHLQGALQQLVLKALQRSQQTMRAQSNTLSCMCVCVARC